MTHILTSWNIKNIGMNRINNSVNDIVRVIEEAGSAVGKKVAHLEFILENQYKSGYVSVALRDAFAKRNLNYHFSYEYSGDQNTKMGEKIIFFWNGMEEPQLFQLKVERAAGKSAHTTLAAERYRDPVAFIYNHEGRVFRVAAFHAPGTDHMKKSIWESVYKRVLEVPTLDIVVGDFNLRRNLEDGEWIDASTSSLGGTTLKKNNKTTKNSYDKVLIRRSSGLRVFDPNRGPDHNLDIRIFKTEVNSFSLSDHHCVSAVIGPLSGGDTAVIR